MLMYFGSLLFWNQSVAFVNYYQVNPTLIKYISITNGKLYAFWFPETFKKVNKLLKNW